MEYEIKLSEAMLKDLVFWKREINVELEGNKYRLSGITAMSLKATLADQTREFEYFCPASKGTKEYRVKLALKVAKGDIWYYGKIVFLSTSK